MLPMATWAWPEGSAIHAAIAASTTDSFGSPVGQEVDHGSQAQQAHCRVDQAAQEGHLVMEGMWQGGCISMVPTP